ncbi:MAG: alpha/beta hydrolase [Deltaproteobacteria bacterium]|nr:alpha/beta hydrolase [Deltaproteobacteria bacterium]
MRVLRGLVVLLCVAALGVTISYVSSQQPPRDVLAAAKLELGIDLESQHVDVGEVTLFVVLAGPPKGEPVVLLHGFPEFWYAWRKPMALLAKAGFRVIVPDQRGYDLSDKPEGIAAYTVDKLAGDVAGLIDALGYERANLAGHDWGGGVAWQVALRHPERVKRLAVIDTPHPRARDGFESTEDPIQWYWTFMQLPWIPELTARLGNYGLLAGNLRDTAQPGTFPEKVMDRFRAAWDQPGARTGMVNWYRAAYQMPPPLAGDGRVAIPTLLIVAPHDAFIAGDLTRRSMLFLDAGQLVELERGTHWVIQEEPERIAALLIEFFSGRPKTAARS